MRRELRRLSPDVRIATAEIQAVLVNEVLKREVVEGEKAQDAVKKLARAANRALRTRQAKTNGEVSEQQLEGQIGD